MCTIQVQKIESSHLSRRNVLFIRRLTSETLAASLLREGDLLLAIDGHVVTRFRDVEIAAGPLGSQRESLELVSFCDDELHFTLCSYVNFRTCKTILRDGKEMKIDVPLSTYATRGTERVVSFCGAVFQSKGDMFNDCFLFSRNFYSNFLPISYLTKLVWMVALTRQFTPVVRKSRVTNIHQFIINDPLVPQYRTFNSEFFEFETPLHHGGVVTDETGKIQAFWFCFNKHSKSGTAALMGMAVELVVDVIDKIRVSMKSGGIDHDVATRGLEIELVYTQIAHARVLGLSDEWVRTMTKVVARKCCFQDSPPSPCFSSFSLINADATYVLPNSFVS